MGSCRIAPFASLIDEAAIAGDVQEGAVKSTLKWIGMTIGVGALWMVTRAVVFYFIGVLAVFATAFQATVNALSKLGRDGEQDARPAPELRVQRDARIVSSLIDLTAVEGARESVGSTN
jgi:hypothetical protein